MDKDILAILTIKADKLMECDGEHFYIEEEVAGNIGDAYWMGIEHGKTIYARELLRKCVKDKLQTEHIRLFNPNNNLVEILHIPGPEDTPADIERARAIVNAVEWDGDMRINLTTAIGAGRVLAKYIEKMEAEREVIENTIDPLWSTE